MDLAPILKLKYPEGSTGPGIGKLKGQCAVFAQTVLDSGPVGMHLQDKIDFIRSNGNCFITANIPEIAKGFRVGDMIFFNIIPDGHVAIITDKPAPGKLALAEANWRKDGKITYGRVISEKDPSILGIGRFPFKIDLGLLPAKVNLNVFLNKMVWHTGIFQKVQDLARQYSGGKLDLNLVPLMKTQFKNWWYRDYPFNGLVYKVIAKEFLDEFVKPLLYPDMHGYFLVINHQEWEGSVYGRQQGQEFAWTSPCKPVSIQMSCEEFDISPWYFGMNAFTHYVIHELSHFLHFVAGQDDKTDRLDNADAKQLAQVFSDLDWDKVYLNIKY